MWVRLRLDIGWSDLISGLGACIQPRIRTSLQLQAEREWPVADDVLACLSVRSGFDLLLQALQLSPGSEVLLTALTVPDMARIVKHHELTPVPVDLDGPGFSPSLSSLQRSLSPATRVLVVAHLFGNRIPMEPIIEFARQHGLFVVEDCAQAYCGTGFVGHPETDAAMFSFGPIKTATALGGGLLRARDDGLFQRMCRIQSRYTVQSRWSYLRRLLKHAVLKAVSSRTIFGAVAKCADAAGWDFDSLINGAARNFSEQKLFDGIRQQPSSPLLSMLLRRWRHYDLNQIHQRAKKGEFLSEQLGGPARPERLPWQTNTFWVFPVFDSQPDSIVERLRQSGFDATRRCRLAVVEPPEDRPYLDPRNMREMLSHMVFLPWHADLPEHALRRMSSVLRNHANPPATCLSGACQEQNC